MYSCKLEIIMSDGSHHFLDFEKNENKLTDARKDNLFSEQFKKECEHELKTTQSAAIKEFAERLKRKAKKPYGDFYEPTVFVEDIDNLLKEMVGDEE